MAEFEIPLVPPRDMADGRPPRVRVRIGDVVHRTSYAWSPAVVDLLQHIERGGFRGAPRALGFDDQGREMLAFIDGEVARGTEFIPDQGGRFDTRRPGFVWRDEVLVQLGRLLRGYHDAASTFPWSGRQWCFEARDPAETICHNEIFPSNTVFRDGLPVGFIDFDTAAPGPRAWELGWVAWTWVPFFRDEKCIAHGLPTGVADKARRLRLLLDAYGVAPDVGIIDAGLERSREFLEAQLTFRDRGVEWELELERRGYFDEARLEIAWVEEHAAALVNA